MRLPPSRDARVRYNHLVNFRIGSSNAAHVILSPRIPERLESKSYWDDGWIDADITISAGAFRGEIQAQLRADDFVRFRDQLRPLYEKLTGAATFETMEGWISIQIKGDGKGHFHADCVADDQPGVGNRLMFGIDFDQTELPEMLRGLDAICEAIPVLGNP